MQRSEEINQGKTKYVKIDMKARTINREEEDIKLQNLKGHLIINI